MKLLLTNNPISFCYSSPLKTLWKQGKLPSVKKGFYGDTLTQDNISLEHLKPHSKGGPTRLSNLVLSSANKNNQRGNLPLKTAFDEKSAETYFDQFIGVMTTFIKNGKEKIFDGDQYIRNTIKTIEKEGVNTSQLVRHLNLKG